MLITCETCSLNGSQISDGTVLRAWEVLAEKPELQHALTDPQNSRYDAEDARKSADEGVRKMANSRAIARCFMEKCVTQTCPIAHINPTLTNK